MEHSKIAIVIGTKAELIKCMPIMLELQRKNRDYWFVHTGQHPLGDSAEAFGVKRPDFILSPEPQISTKFWSKIDKFSLGWFFMMIFKIKRLIKSLDPKYVVYHGDTMSTAAASVGSSNFLNTKKKWKNVHLEAGLRSGSFFEPFPEEISRRISDKFSDILFAVSALTKKNLEKERPRGKIIKVGNTIVDSANISYRKNLRGKIKIPKNNYALINIHRHENLKSKKRMRNIIEILKGTKFKALWPLHDNTKHYLEKYNLLKELESMPNVEIMPLTDYPIFINLLANCSYLITDGGSIQEESLVFKKPTILLRKRTERQEGLSTGINFLTKLNIDDTKKIIQDIEKGLKIKNFKNPYGNNGVSKKVINKLK